MSLSEPESSPPKWFRPLARWGLSVLRPVLPESWFYRLEHAAWFIFVGGLNTGLSYVIFVLLLNLFSLPRTFALLGAYGLGMVIAYHSFSRFVFRTGVKGAVPRFVFAYILLYLSNKGLLDAVVGFGLGEELGQFLLLPVVALLSYLLNKILVFRT
jgi:putative flippase GtrA